MILTPLTSVTSPGLVYGQFPPASAARSTITDPLRINPTISSVIVIGAFLPGIRAVVMMMSTSAAYFLNSSAYALRNSGVISLVYPPSSLIPPSIWTYTNSAPSDSTYSFTAGRVSVPLTMAPRLLAVAIAARPATPPPITNTLAGGSLPAAVI